MIKQTMLDILPLFISRQSLIHQAMSDLRPDLLLLAEDRSRMSKEQIVEQHLKARELSAEHVHVPQSGIWKSENQEWDYFIHGLGCRLINTATGEPLDWDAPDVDLFHEERFICWVKWHLQTQTQSTPSDEILIEAFKELAAIGSIEEAKIRHGGGIRYRHILLTSAFNALVFS